MAHTTFPSDLPVPKDDGAYDHLTDFTIPADISLPVAHSPQQKIRLAELEGLTVVFCYPRTGAPNEIVPDSWNAIPGARGCTPQACSFRDNLPQLRSLGVSHIYGISTQSPSYQAEVRERLHLPYDLLSDENLDFQRGLKLPTFEWEGGKVLRRSMIALRDGKVIKWWYPVFPPDRGVDDLIEWLKAEQSLV
ncbi:redoxin domain-containing protein [Cladophialophora carrionii]|uniref:Redoxin domain-containing protein n=1 Tax=Cladophialophora carrionii TaxID=86049 RepID=A0A1C1CHP1_9EURO|nr:redoxin domain-containing protein [Cladophialophora carrionii]